MGAMSACVSSRSAEMSVPAVSQAPKMVPGQVAVSEIVGDQDALRHHRIEGERGIERERDFAVIARVGRRGEQGIRRPGEPVAVPVPPEAHVRDGRRIVAVPFGVEPDPGDLHGNRPLRRQVVRRDGDVLRGPPEIAVRHREPRPHLEVGRPRLVVEEDLRDAVRVAEAPLDPGGVRLVEGADVVPVAADPPSGGLVRPGLPAVVGHARRAAEDSEPLARRREVHVRDAGVGEELPGGAEVARPVEPAGQRRSHVRHEEPVPPARKVRRAIARVGDDGVLVRDGPGPVRGARRGGSSAAAVRSAERERPAVGIGAERRAARGRRPVGPDRPAGPAVVRFPENVPEQAAVPLNGAAGRAEHDQPARARLREADHAQRVGVRGDRQGDERPRSAAVRRAVEPAAAGPAGDAGGDGEDEAVVGVGEMEGAVDVGEEGPARLGDPQADLAPGQPSVGRAVQLDPLRVRAARADAEHDEADLRARELRGPLPVGRLAPVRRVTGEVLPVVHEREADAARPARPDVHGCPLALLGEAVELRRLDEEERHVAGRHAAEGELARGRIHQRFDPGPLDAHPHAGEAGLRAEGGGRNRDGPRHGDAGGGGGRVRRGGGTCRDQRKPCDQREPGGNRAAH